MLILLDELFDLHTDKQWLRRQLPILLKQLAGDKLSRKVVSYSDWFVSSEQVASYLRDFRETMWPNGQLAPSKPQQSVHVQALRSLLARAKVIGSVAGECVGDSIESEREREGGKEREMYFFLSSSLHFSR